MAFFDMFSPLTLFFMGLIALMTIYFHGPVYSLRTVNAAPSILTSVGIFGTFLGIALGLMEFDAADVEASVPQLIEGLKTAFWSSIAGLFGAMTIKLRHVLNHVRGMDGSTQVTGATMDDLATLLGDIRLLLKNSGLTRIDEYMKNNDQRLQASLKKLGEGIGDYQQQMADANSKALVTALETLLKDFNQQIGAQYGENFQQLNEAVGQMLQWQENYKEELEALLNEQRANGQVLDKATEAYKTMVEHTQSFNVVADTLGEVMSGLQQQSESLGSYLDSLANLVNKAGGGLPKLEERIHTLTDGLAGQLDRQHQQMQKLMDNSAKRVASSVENMNDLLGPRLDDQLGRQQKLMERSLDRTEQQLVRMDAALEHELTHSLQTFGSQLAALSEKFVSDYTPLTDKLRELVHLSEKIQKTAERKAGDA
jgi:ABC-type transporter Mla subunit MlaD